MTAIDQSCRKHAVKRRLWVALPRGQWPAAGPLQYRPAWQWRGVASRWVWIAAVPTGFFSTAVWLPPAHHELGNARHVSYQVGAMDDQSLAQ